MDFSKWRKIFYIVAIVSMLLSIKTKVFGSYETTINNNTVTFSDAFLDSTPYFAFFTYNSGASAYVVRSNQPIKYKYDGIYNNSKRYIFSGTGSSSDRDMKRKFGTFQVCSDWVNGSSYSALTHTQYSETELYFNIETNFTLEPQFSNNDLYDYDNSNTVVFSGTNTNPFIYPHFDNVTEITSGYPDGVYISRGDYSSSDDLYFHLLQINYSVPNSDTTLYYYNDHIFTLNENSKYYRQYDADQNNEYSYYFVSRADLSLDTNSSYLYVLSNTGSGIQNSFGLLTTDEENGYFHVISSDTTGVISEAESQTDKLKKIEQGLVEQANTTNSIQNSLTNTDPDNSTGDNIDTSLSFDNQNQTLTNMNMGFFSNLTSLLTSLLDYDLSVVDEVAIPLPFYERLDINGDLIKTLTLKSNLMSSHLSVVHGNITYDLSLIFNAFWLYIFGFYLWRFINKIYIAISTGNILDTFSSSHEAITNDML